MNTPETMAAMGRTAKKYHRAGVDALGRNRPEDAVRALRLAVELDPGLEIAWNDLGVVMEALGNTNEAVRCYKRALAVRAGWSWGMGGMGGMFDVGCWMSDVGCRMLNFGFRISDVGCRISDVGC